MVVLLCTLQCCKEYSTTVSLFQAKSVRVRFHWIPYCEHKELINEDMLKLETQRKDEERQEEEEVTEEQKRFMMWKMARWTSLSEDPNVEQYTKVAGAVQNAVQHHYIIHDEKNRASTQTLPEHFFKRVDRIEYSKEPEPVTSMSGMSEIEACLTTPTSYDSSALPSLTSSPFSSQQFFLPFHLTPALYASHCTVLPYFSRYCTVWLKMFYSLCLLL